jgi:hypothetical protein
MRILGLAALCAAVGCTVTRSTPPPALTEPVFTIPAAQRWHLTERPYGAIEESWTSAGDGQIPGDARALLFEPIYGQEKRETPQPVLPGLTPCLHRIRLRREGPQGMSVGEIARIDLEIEGGPGILHGVRIEGSHGGIEIFEVRGATPVVGRKGVYAVYGGTSAQVRFTSRFAGRGGLKIELLGETSLLRSPSPGDAIAQQP